MNDEILVLDSETSIILPFFDTSPILEDSINSIVLSLFVLEKTPDTKEKVHITINPIDLSTRKVDDGFSSFVDITKGQYADFELPKELFEKVVKTNKRFLLHLVGKNQRITFQGADAVGTSRDPVLIINHDSAKDITSDELLKEYNYYNFNNSQIIFGNGDNIKGDKIIDNPDVPLWLKYVLAIIGILGFLLTAYSSFNGE